MSEGACCCYCGGRIPYREVADREEVIFWCGACFRVTVLAPPVSRFPIPRREPSPQAALPGG